MPICPNCGRAVAMEPPMEWWERLNNLTGRLGGLPGDKQLDVIEHAALRLERIAAEVVAIEPTATTHKPTTVNIMAMDGPSFQQFLSKHPDALNSIKYPDDELDDAKRKAMAWGKDGRLDYLEADLRSVDYSVVRTDSVAMRIRSAILAEREACALIAEDIPGTCVTVMPGESSEINRIIAKRIRERTA